MNHQIEDLPQWLANWQDKYLQEFTATKEDFHPEVYRDAVREARAHTSHVCAASIAARGASGGPALAIVQQADAIFKRALKEFDVRLTRRGIKYLSGNPKP